MEQVSDETKRLFEAVLTLKTADECQHFFEDVCTIKEVEEIAQRFRVAELLKKGMSYLKISNETGASTATIGRVNRCIEYGNGGYSLAIKRLSDIKGD